MWLIAFASWLRAFLAPTRTNWNDIGTTPLWVNYSSMTSMNMFERPFVSQRSFNADDSRVLLMNLKQQFSLENVTRILEDVKQEWDDQVNSTKKHWSIFLKKFSLPIFQTDRPDVSNERCGSREFDWIWINFIPHVNFCLFLWICESPESGNLWSCWVALTRIASAYSVFTPNWVTLYWSICGEESRTKRFSQSIDRGRLIALETSKFNRSLDTWLLPQVTFELLP